MTTLAQGPAAKQWQSIGIRQHRGIAVPLFSLRSRDSCGIGEFTDLLPLFPWCKSLGLEVIQLLPLNDTGEETSPYSALSAFALNPIHISLTALPAVPEELRKKISDLQQLSATQRVCYKKVLQGKMEFLREYYRLMPVTDIPQFSQFKQDNRRWCYDYAHFKAIKLKTAWQSWEEWPATDHFASDEFLLEIDFHQYLQYLCFEQWKQVKNSAETHGIFLKGDIPILINRESADVWCHSRYFDLDLAAGAPPDMYAKEGQKWGFPLYNWETIAANNYQWWIDRLAVAAQLYHIYRIDHIVGFYRIWGIPLELPATQGRFVPPDESTWIPHGETILRVMIDNCPMLPIGEDLGTIPPPVRVSLRALGICGTKVMRWERRWNEDGGFIAPQDYPVESMTTVSTHDSETLAQWWTLHPDEASLYARSVGWNYDGVLSPEHRIAILTASNHTASLFHINLLNEYLALFPELVWPNPEDERINIPGTIADTNWTYRFRPFVEEIVAHTGLKESMRKIITL